MNIIHVPKAPEVAPVAASTSTKSTKAELNALVRKIRKALQGTDIRLLRPRGRRAFAEVGYYLSFRGRIVARSVDIEELAVVGASKYLYDQSGQFDPAT